uniref:Threonyl/alanyl tRNA synthetase SAD domain-containing protein n=1 Tax=Brassica campestris TaxID=3711 RepID=M4E070_BRACM
MDSPPPTKLEYHEDMFKLQSQATFLSLFKVLHYGVFQGSNPEDVEKGKEVHLLVDESRRKLNSRQGKLNRSCSLVLHSAGHLLDLCMQKVGLGHLEPGKGYHFPDGPFVEYKGVVPQAELLVKQKELEAEANELISKGGKVYADILPYEEASLLCGGTLPDYIPKGSTPRVLRLGENPGCPCGGTHVSDISDIISMKITQMRTKKGMTKVFYTIAS